jgi:hypothetical protein
VLDHGERTAPSGRRELLFVQPQTPLVGVDEEGGDPQVRLQDVVVDRVGVHQLERGTNRLSCHRPVAVRDSQEPPKQGSGSQRVTRSVLRWGAAQQRRVELAR